jgi:hypothetical protein
MDIALEEFDKGPSRVSLSLTLGRFLVPSPGSVHQIGPTLGEKGRECTQQSARIYGAHGRRDDAGGDATSPASD